MNNSEKIEEEITNIKKRNEKVEIDKAWETSVSRRLLIAILTYFVIVIFFIVANLSKPFMNAIVPTAGFILSTLTVSFVKKMWVKRFYLK